jgi:hypothetical protein
LTVTAVDADFDGSATLVAVTWNDPVVLGVYRPEADTEPLVAFHVTAVFELPDTVALNCAVLPSWIVAVVGVIATATTLAAEAAPLSATVALEALLVIATDPVKVPADVGANLIGNAEEVPAAIVIGNVVPARLKPVPVTVAPVTDSDEPPLFEIVTFNVLELPLVMLPKLSELGATDSWAGAGFTVTVAVADFVASATLVALTL